MLKVYYGDDRVRAQSAIKKELGSNYEVFEAENLQVADLDSVFWGLSLFGEERKILIKDFPLLQVLENMFGKRVWNTLLTYNKLYQNLLRFLLGKIQELRYVKTYFI